MQETTLHIVGTDLLDYSFKVEKAIKEGWTFSDKNEYSPRAWPHMFEAWMLRDNTNISGVFLKNEFPDILKPSQSLSIASEITSEGVGSQKDTEVITERSKSVSKRGRK